MLRTRIVGAVGALALLAAPAVAVAHGDGHHGGKHGKKHHHKKKHPRDVTGTAVATIQSFANGELTLSLPSGRTFTADVTDRSVIICRTAAAPVTPAAKASHDGPGKGKHGDDDATTTAPPSTTTPPATVPDNSQGRCGTDKLIAGAKVSDARLSLKGDTVIWKKVIVVS
ncbi:hypothetical protein [Baekduia sp. Peel2402]|uniref:hypothetical protein n=1 Tax=Baekduia sp. Peel2402 TaxID=3458296 RepID=UPI00403E9C56